MNYLAILSLILGLVSVVITLQFIKYYDSFDKKLTKVNNACSTKDIPTAIFDIQDDLNISDKEFNELISKNKAEIISIIKNNVSKLNNQEADDIKEKDKEIDKDTEVDEQFTNYSYINYNERNLDNIKTSEFIQKQTKPCILKKRNYKIDILQSKIGAKQLTPMVPLLPKNPNIVNYSLDNSNNGLRYQFIKKNWCVVNHDDKNYCFAITKLNNCPSKIIINNRSTCNH